MNRIVINNIIKISTLHVYTYIYTYIYRVVVCVCFTAIQLVNSQLRLLQSVQGLTRGLWQSGPGSRSPAVRHMHTGLVYEPRTRALVLNGAPGHVQFYDLHKDEQLFTVRVFIFTFLRHVTN